ncbi:MAG TPA: Ig domain-containing protein [Candidatus Nanoarchaeia archaeon]|nr:Ig domain-containing protein [Candidatus Nanoarchaeia archaeon]
MNLKFLLTTIFAIFLIGNISAIAVYGEWENGSQITTITEGDDLDFNFDFITMSPPMTINVKVYDSSGNLVYAFDNNKQINDRSYSKIYNVNQSVYGTNGNFRILIWGSDSRGSNFSELTLIVNPQPPQSINNPPQIISNPITGVNEHQVYTYSVIAVDTDGNILTYSLIQSPSWLSINSVNGLITGTAPNVATNTNYAVIVGVSDGSLNASQNYTLTVLDIPSQPQSDTNPPTVIITYPSNTLYNTQITQLSYTSVDAEGNLNQCWYSTDMGVTNSTPSACAGFFNINSTTGINRWIVYASDVVGNVGSAMVTFNVSLSNNGNNGNDEDENNKTNKKTFDYRDVDEDRYLEELYGKKTIIIYEEEKEKSWFWKLIEWIINSFKRVFGFD